VLIPLRARKILRDLASARVRVLTMIVAIAVSVAAVGAVLGGRAILEREIAVNYLGTHPASATLAVPGGADEAALRIARARPGVLDAALRTRRVARIVLPDGRRAPVLLFVAPASDPMRVAGFQVERGNWPPASGELLLERSSLAFFGLRVGQPIDLEMRNGRHGSVRIGGVVHDGAVSPSSQERIAYAYATPALLARLGDAVTLDSVKILVGDGGRESGSVRRIDAVAQDAGTALRARGIAVTRIDAPPPFRHPHQSQMQTAVGLLQLFAQLALLLSAILVATLLGGMLAQQMRQIGVMKTLGAGNTTVFGMYLAMTAAVAAAATLVALVPGVIGARYLATVVGDLFGIEITSYVIPRGVFATEIAAGVLVPVAVALVPLMRSTQITVREAIDGVSRGSTAFGATPLQAWLARRGIGNRTIRLALRNVVRRPGRLMLVVLLLGTSGAMFVSALSTADGLQAVVDGGMSHRHYDLEVRLAASEDAARVARVMAGVPEIAAFESASSAQAIAPHDGAIDLTRTYPDGGHGSYAIASLRPGSPILALPLKQGRALHPGDAGAVVFNQLVIPQQAHGARVGQDVAISVNGRVSRYTLAGIVSDFGSPATAYVTEEGFARASGENGRVSLVRVVTRRHDRAGRDAAVRTLQQRFADDGIALRGTVVLGAFKLALDGHAAALANTLAAIAVVMAVVGVLSLISAIAGGVLERTREFGVMRSLGASSAAIAGIVAAEGMLYGALSALAAIVLSIPLTLALDGFIGTQAFFVPLPFALSPIGAAIATAVALLAAAAASAVGAHAAARLTIREALAAV
jgi:putative ABC transport system permease protein